MKRIIICAVLLVFAVWVSMFSYLRVERVNDGINARIDALESAISEENAEVLAAGTAEIAEYWDKEERVLVHFVRHSYIDIVTTSVVRLPALAEHGDYGELNAELFNIRRQMKHIRASEVLTLDNLL